MVERPAAFEEIAETFELLDDWEERYKYVIELGRGLSGLPDAQKTPATKVEGVRQPSVACGGSAAR